MGEEQHERAFESGQREVLELIAKGAPLVTQLEQIVLLIEAQAAQMLCSILVLDREQGRLRTGAAPNLPAEFMRAINGSKIGPNEGSCGAAAHRGQRVIVEDIATHPYWQNYRQFALPHGLRACWSSPIAAAGGAVLGTFAMYFKEVRAPSPRELHWVDRATHLASIAIEREQSEAKLRLLAHIHDTVSDVIFYLAVEPGEQFRFLSINPAFVTATGLTAERVVGHLVQDVIPPQSLDKVLTNYRKAIAQDRTVRWFEVSPYPTGTRHGEVSISPIFSADGVCTNLIGTVHDVTEQYQAQERIFHAQRLESLGTLVGGLAHDFNNILMVVSGNAGLAQLHKDPAKQHQALQQIENASAHGAALIKQLLIFSRRQQAPRGVAALAPLVEETLALAQATLPKNIDVQTAFDHGVPAILADATQVHQVVLNLITNAAQAMAHGGTLTLKVEERTLDAGSAQPLNVPPGTYAKLTVRDTGTGMSDATLQHIFDPFFTTKEPGVGTGLGLAVVHGIVKSHNGAVTVRSAPGQGSEFNVYFPAHTSG